MNAERYGPELSEAAVPPALNTRWLGRAYHYVAHTGSTNDQLKAWSAADGESVRHGTVLLTDYQSAGRGRLDRRWEAPQGSSLLFSVLLRPGWPAERAGWLTMLAALSVTEAIEAVAGLPARLKWPNDILIPHDGAWGKACGTLLDSTLDAGGRLEIAILGIGINVNVPREALPRASTPAASLMLGSGRPVARRDLLVELLSRLERYYETADAGQSPAAAWRERLVTLGQAVEVTQAGTRETLRGVAEDVDEWGRLLVRDAGGRLHAVVAGDVSLGGQ